MTIREDMFICPECKKRNPASRWNQLTQECNPPWERIAPIQNAKRKGWDDVEYMCPACGAPSRVGDIDMQEGLQSEW